MQTANDIRKAFLDFFATNGHQHVASSPLVPHNDPTLMFVNAGMVQFKNVFTGMETRDYTRAVTSQKCVRAGGKHNDLENVGHTARHHTFFEMLGNFSFGDYFKDDAIDLAWKLITKDYGLDPNRLLVTVYHTDDQAFDIWKKVAGLPDERIIRIPTSDNFWSMGDTGPCGPCSEIFYDHGDHIAGGPPGSPDEDGDRFVEIWNLVFMQYEQHADGSRIELPKPSIDTGMGLERITAVMQGTHDNYDIDLMRALIMASAHATNTDPDGVHRVSHRVIADHLRATAFLIADGVLPSNEGRGYVLRRIMRRAMRHAHMIGATEPVIYKLFPALQAKMSAAFPELNRAEALITETLKLEETRFIKTLDRGLKLLDEATVDMRDGGELDGETAFKLYDTYGFPLDLTQDALRAKGIRVDEAGFKSAMEQQKAAARASWSGSGDAATDALWFDIKDDVGATDFLGYKTEQAQGQVTAIAVGGARVSEAKVGDEVMVVTNQTPFYGESGGQMGDIGTLFADGLVVEVTDTQKKLGVLHVHVGKITKGTLKVGDEVTLNVNHANRAAIRANHSATHLLHAALRMKLGEHVTQKGSMVSSERLRFDISQPIAVTPAELSEVELLVNDQVRANTEVTTRLMAPEEAVEAGAMALFGEKYGDEVRVLSMGTVVPGSTREFSVELCGGTHVNRTGDIGLLKVVSEGAVSSGVRRIEALTGAAAVAYMEAQEAALLAAAATLKAAPGDVPGRVQQLVDERKKMEREISDLRKKLASGGGAGGAAETKDVGGITFMAKVLEEISGKDLKGLADDLKSQIKSGVVALVAVADGKASLVIGVTADLTDKINAVDLVRVGAAVVGGKGGGGRPDMAQAGGPDGDKAQAALDAIEAALAS
ncbi:alanine--tRNA ligase [Magnetovibrio blakemorei]|uniref:Alanine--tRNA ligase n=1 Tax=Magnetovibrio blakemorei TaxID=28181 RepID=A0A1E5Q9T1_9PROT|nr:alanine--tRNA ligase [Magnetovibrio blakemorei]OEJ68482.1 alanine--tRNA ligase [Magnetovibrio blakemorei]